MKNRSLLTLGIIGLLLLNGFLIAVDSSRSDDFNFEMDDSTVSADVLFAEGNGTEEDPYQISNVTQLQNMNQNLSAHYELVNDIDASETKDWNNEKGFAPVETFTGSLDGQGYNITGLYINRSSSSSVGLFGYMRESASVKKVGVVDAEMKGDYNVGGLAGYVKGTISNSYVIGNVSGDYDVGGLVGQNNKGMVKNSYATGNVSGDRNVGGLVGRNYEGTVNNSHYNIDEVFINGGHHLTIGGLFDEQYQDWISSNRMLDIEDYNTTLVPSGEYYNITDVQGLKDLLGFADDEQYKFRLSSDIDLSSESGLYLPYLAANFNGYGHTIKNLHLNSSGPSVCGFVGYANESASVRDVGIVGAKVTGNNHVGGLMGYNTGTVNNSYTTGKVSGYSYVGGLVGKNRGTVNNSYATGNVTGGGTDVGGLAGENRGTVNNSYATGNVSGDRDYVGGLVGMNYEGMVTNSYATGNVSGGSAVGGLVGFSQEAPVSNSFWDVNTTGQSSSAGGTGKKTSEMKKISTFTDVSTEGLNEPWDFVGNPNDDDSNKNIWNMNDKTNNGYPFFNWSIDTTPPDANAGGDKTVAIGEQFTLDGTGSTDNEGIVNYTWTRSGNKYYGSKITHSFSSTGTYQFKLNVTDSWRNYDTDTVNITVQEDDIKPTASASADKTTVAIGESVSFDASGSSDNVGIDSYSWEFGDGNTRSDETTTHTYDSPGEYTVTLTVTDSAENTATDTLEITVEENEDTIPPTADAGDDKRVEVGEEFTLDASSSSDNVGIASYEWGLDNGDTKTGKQITYTYDETGNYTVELTVTDEAGNTDTDTVEITVEESDGGDDDGGGDDKGEGIPGFTMVALLSSMILVTFYEYKKKRRQ